MITNEAEKYIKIKLKGHGKVAIAIASAKTETTTTTSAIEKSHETIRDDSLVIKTN